VVATTRAKLAQIYPPRRARRRVSPFFPPLHNRFPPPIPLALSFLLLLRPLPTPPLPLFSFFLFIKPPRAICSRLRGATTRCNPEILCNRANRAVTNVRPPLPRSHPEPTPSLLAPVHYLPRECAGMRRFAFLLLAHSQGDSLVRASPVYTAPIWKIICHAGEERGGGGRPRARRGGTHPLSRGPTARSFVRPFAHAVRFQPVRTHCATHVQGWILFKTGRGRTRSFSGRSIRGLSCVSFLFFLEKSSARASFHLNIMACLQHRSTSTCCSM